MCRVAALNCILLQYSFGSLPYSFSLQAVLFTAILCSGLKVIAYGCGHYLLWRLFIVMLGYSKLTNFSFIVGFFINSTDTLIWKEVYIATWLPLNPLLCHRASLRRVGGGVSGVNGPHAPALVVLVSPTRTEHASGLTGKNITSCNFVLSFCLFAAAAMGRAVVWTSSTALAVCRWAPACAEMFPKYKVYWFPMYI